MNGRLKRGTPKQRCEIRLPAELDVRLDKIADKAGVTRTAVVITAIERLIYGEETVVVRNPGIASPATNIGVPAV